MATVINEVRLPIYGINIKIKDNGKNLMTWEFNGDVRFEDLRKDLEKHITYYLEYKGEDYAVESVKKLVEERKVELAEKEANPRVFTSNVTVYKLNGDNLTLAMMKPYEESCEFRFSSTIQRESNSAFSKTTYPIEFMFSLGREVFDKILNDKYSVISSDGLRIIEVQRDGIKILPSFHHIELGYQISEYIIEIRRKEFIEVIKKAMELKSGDNEVDVLGDIKNSNEMAKPNLTITYYDGAKEIIEDPENAENGITLLVNEVIKRSEDSSSGQDDPVEIVFYPDDWERNSEKKRSLGWTRIQSGNKNYCGGINWSKTSETYSINT